MDLGNPDRFRSHDSQQMLPNERNRGLIEAKLEGS
jgi:hypothetical protein